ncbi:hypothetical protein Pcinc_024466 [Petrolisthes cinctipes]|uniref:non-specific serine/threonine protein kinase n=1 Tax=Petrolisthes cinctipes TaxID=88211 RepID=A0AAE1FAE6_PETCI|nr:hypothetical protein Pcinc_024466 [Petrolisthes cinctipes]
MWSVRAVLERVVQHGRRALQQTHQHTHRYHKLSKCGSEGAGRRVAENGARQSVTSSLVPAVDSSVVTRFVQGFVRKVSAPLWTDARRRATKRLVFGESAPFFALVGVTLVSGSQQGLVTKEDELEALCGNVRDAISRAGWLHDPEYWRHHTSKDQEETNQQQDQTLSLADFTLGPVIGQGCNAAVYAARWQAEERGDPLHSPPPKRQRSVSPEEDESDMLNEDEELFTLAVEELQDSSQSDEEQASVSDGYATPTGLEDITQRFGDLRKSSDTLHSSRSSKPREEQRRVTFKLAEKRQGSNEEVEPEDSTQRGAIARTSVSVTHNTDNGSDCGVKDYPLAMKMMFNYEAESNAPAILRAMCKELLPARCVQLDEEQLEWQERLCGKLTPLPPHPNIVEMPFVFVDRVPLLEDSMSLYPNALPARLNPGGYGRNMSLFCVMKRYDASLREYLSQSHPSEHTCLLLLTQLLEAVLHINTHGVAHRDLKSDNILLSLGEGWDYPLLVLTDFGCSIASDSSNISVRFPSLDADPRQGNPALMAPEIITAVPGLIQSVNFSHSDLWAAGALAYEIYGQENPFCGPQQEASKKKQKALNSATYKESQLPRLSKKAPPAVRHLVHDLLRRNPRNRPSPAVAATLCQLLLWAPSKWLSRHALTLPTHTEIMQWLLCLTTKVLCEARLSSNKDRHSRVSEGKKKRDEDDNVRTSSSVDRQGGQLEYELVSTFLGRVNYSDIIQAIKWNRAF